MNGKSKFDKEETSFVKQSYDKVWKESRRTKSLLKFFSSEDMKKAVENEPEDDSSGYPPYNRLQMTGLIMGPLLFVLTLLFLQTDGLDRSGIFVVASALWIATWWMTEAIPIPATSLMPLFLFPMGGVMGSDQVSSAYGADIIFLFSAGFYLRWLWRSGIYIHVWHSRSSVQSVPLQRPSCSAS